MLSDHSGIELETNNKIVSGKVSKYQETAAAAKSLQMCPTLCDPIGGSPPGFWSLGFSRQEHWSGLPFPSPVRKLNYFYISNGSNKKSKEKL